MNRSYYRDRLIKLSNSNFQFMFDNTEPNKIMKTSVLCLCRLFRIQLLSNNWEYVVGLIKEEFDSIQNLKDRICNYDINTRNHISSEQIMHIRSSLSTSQENENFQLILNSWILSWI